MSGAAHRASPAGNPAAERADQARTLWLERHEDGIVLGARELGARFGRSERWGSYRIAEARDTLTPQDEPAPSNGHAAPPQPVLHPAAAPAVASRAIERVTATAVLAVALTAAATSYEHMRHLALAAGEGWRAWLLPLSVDGMMVAASMTMLVRRRAGRPAGALAWTALLAGVAASMAANVAAALPTPTGRLVAAWPPLALLLAYELLLQQRKSQP